MPIRSLLVVAALAAGDYLLWTWSSDGNSATVALGSGLVLALLVIALLWLIAVGVVRILLRRALLARAPGGEMRQVSRRQAGRRSRRHAADALVGEASAQKPSQADGARRGSPAARPHGRRAGGATGRHFEDRTASASASRTGPSQSRSDRVAA